MQIRLDNLERSYGKVHAVDGISLFVPQNRIFGIIGRSGAGKSTLVRLMSLLETPDSGQVLYDDRRVDNLTKQDLIAQRRKIGMIFQNFNLFSSRTAGQNIAYPMEICGYQKSQIETRVQELLNLVGLEDRNDAPISTPKRRTETARGDSKGSCMQTRSPFLR